MKLFVKILFSLLTVASPMLGQTPHLQLHFDINKTLIASDKAGGKSIADVLNQLLAADCRYQWDPALPEPITYESYIKEVLLPGPDYDLELKKQRKYHLDHFLELLAAQNHPLYPELQRKYDTALEKLQNGSGNVFSSFYRLLERLDREKLPYTLFLRSFGTEVFDIAEEINHTYQPKFAQNGVFKRGALYIEGQLITTQISELYAFLASGQHTAIQDDWEYWMQGAMGKPFGKLFPVDLNDSQELGIFFDDNLELNDGSTNIVAPIDVQTGQAMAISTLTQQTRLVRVDTLEAILNENYYNELVDKALESFAMAQPA